MTNIYEGVPDDRQETEIVPEERRKATRSLPRFRPRYRALNDDDKALHDALKDKAQELADIFDKVPDGRYKALAFTSLEESVMWIVKELTA